MEKIKKMLHLDHEDDHTTSQTTASSTPLQGHAGQTGNTGTANLGTTGHNQTTGATGHNTTSGLTSGHAGTGLTGGTSGLTGQSEKQRLEREIAGVSGTNQTSASNTGLTGRNTATGTTGTTVGSSEKQHLERELEGKHATSSGLASNNPYGSTTASSTGNTSSGLGNTSSELGNTSSGLGNTSSGLGNTSSGLGNTSSGLGNTSSGLGNTSSGLHSNKNSGLASSQGTDSSYGATGGYSTRAANLLDPHTSSGVGREDAIHHSHQSGGGAEEADTAHGGSDGSNKFLGNTIPGTNVGLRHNKDLTEAERLERKEEKHERKEEHHHHTGRDVGIVGAAGGVGAYEEAGKHHHTSHTTGDHTARDVGIVGAAGGAGVHEVGKHHHDSHTSGVPLDEKTPGRDLGDKLHGSARNRGVNGPTGFPDEPGFGQAHTIGQDHAGRSGALGAHATPGSGTDSYTGTGSAVNRDTSGLSSQLGNTGLNDKSQHGSHLGREEHQGHGTTGRLEGKLEDRLDGNTGVSGSTIGSGNKY